MRTWVAGICLSLLPVFAAGQSLAETARKERERREALREAGQSSTTVTEAELATSAGRVANDQQEGAADADEERPGREPVEASPPSASTSAGASASDAATARETAERYWRKRTTEAKMRVEEAEREYQRLDRMIRIGQGARTDENGRRVMLSAAALKRRADEAQAELVAAQAALEELRKEGRRAGALPGWLR